MTKQDSAIRRRGGWLWRLFSVGSLVALFGGHAGLAASDSSTPDTGYRPASGVPEAWRQFAGGLQRRFQERLAGSDADAQRVQDYFAGREAAGHLIAALVLQTWILDDGKVERVVFDGVDDGDVAASLRALLQRGDVGTPPPDMPQPLHLRLSLRPAPQPEQ